MFIKKLFRYTCFLACCWLMTNLQAQEVRAFNPPEYPGCEAIADDSERTRCSRELLDVYIKKHLKYPRAARKANIEGTVMVNVSLDKEGKITEVAAPRDIGGGCAAAAVAVFERMRRKKMRWKPATARNGEPLAYDMAFPVGFWLPYTEKPNEIGPILSAEGMVEEMVEEEPPPPPPPLIVEEEMVVEDDIAIEIEEEMVVEDDSPPRVAQEREYPSPPPAPEPVVEAEEQPFRVVEEMPRFFDESCETGRSGKTPKACAQEKMVDFFATNQRYPAIALENGVEGTCVVQFIVEEDGNLSNVQLVRDVGAGCGQEAIRLTRLMNENGRRWVPGKQRGRAVRVQMTIPIPFRLPVEEEIEEEMPPPPAPERTKNGNNEQVFIPEDAMSVEDEITMDDIPRPDTVEREVAAPPPPPPPPPAMSQGGGDIFKVVEEMPYYKGEDCEAFSSYNEKKNCGQEAMLDFIYANLQYPPIAKENGVEGTCVVTFIVSKDGTVEDIRVVRDIGAQCGNEAARLVRMMNENGPNWVPGRQRGRAVRVQYNLPVKFNLDE